MPRLRPRERTRVYEGDAEKASGIISSVANREQRSIAVEARRLPVSRAAQVLLLGPSDQAALAAARTDAERRDPTAMRSDESKRRTAVSSIQEPQLVEQRGAARRV